ncbi:MAG: hypothetical protein WCL44_02240 [bacterium]
MNMTRLMLDNDGSNFILNLGEDIETTIAETVRECPPDVTTYLLCSAAGTCYYPTKVGCPVPSVTAALAHGLDPFVLLLRGLKAAGKETFITYRMNDVHNPTDTSQWNTPRIRREHPEYVVGIDEIRAGKAEWMSYCLDYGRQEVRQYVLDIIAEQVELYGDTLDGFQLDWMRFPRHLSGTPDEVWEKREIITGFLREVRGILRRGGRKILLSARVPTSPAGCRRLGFDLAAWGREGLVDLIVACPFLTTEWQIPIGEMRQWLGNQAVAVVGGSDMGFGRQPHGPESLRGIASTLYDLGSDGVYLFNFPCWSEYLAVRPYHWLAGLGDPRTAAAKPLLLAVEHSQHRLASIDQPAQIPAALPAGGVLDLTIHVPRSALPAWRTRVLVRSHGDVALQVNGREAAHILFGERLPYRNSLFGELDIPENTPDMRVKPEDCRVFRVVPDTLMPGLNRLRLTNRTDRAIEIERVNLGLW